MANALTISRISSTLCSLMERISGYGPGGVGSSPTGVTG